MTASSVAVIGAGASGTIQALHLLREGVGQVTLIEREREPGRGVAYGTRRPEHLLNVAARRMIVYPDDPDHFARWFAVRGGDPDGYAPRMLFGDYLCELMRESGERLRLVDGEAVDVAGNGQPRVILDDGRVIETDVAVLALGNLRPATPPGIDPNALGDIYVEDPWFGGFVEGLAEQDKVLLIGTGLTAIDAALTLEASGYRGRIIGISRRGLAPRAHLKREPVANSPGAYPAGGAARLRAVRRRGDAIGWREAVHELRPVTQQLWHQSDLDQRRRFIRHLRPWWDVHRHRIAPAVAARIDNMVAKGRLAIAAGRILAATRSGNSAEVVWRPRRQPTAERLHTARIVNCTGPDLDIARCGDRLLDALLDSGRIRPDECRLGLDVDQESRVRSANGVASERLAAIGPITRGAFWESIAVPDIAVQAQAVARRLARNDPAR